MTEPAQWAQGSGEVPCSYHPNAMTRLRCSRCEKPICPKCAVRTPVGLRCPDCAGVRGLPTYRAEPTVLTRAALFGAGAAVAVALPWLFMDGWAFYLTLLAAFGVTEVISRTASHKRGPELQALAIGLVVLSLVLGRVLLASRLGISWAEVNAFGPRVQFDLHLRGRPDAIFLALALIIPWYRFR